MNERIRHYKSRGNRGREFKPLTPEQKAQITYAVEKMWEQIDKHKSS